MSRLARFEQRWARAAFETLFPSDTCAALPEGIAACDIEAYMNDLRGSISWEASLGLRVAVWMVALSPLWVLRRLTTIASLARADRERVLTSLLASRTYFVRQLVVLLKAMGALLYAGAPNVRERILTPLQQAPLEPLPIRLLARKGAA
jgi:hypothetical protein